MNLPPPGYSIVFDPPGNGACAPNAVSFALNRSFSSDQLRIMVAAELLQNRVNYEPFYLPYAEGLCYLCWVVEHKVQSFYFCDPSMQSLANSAGLDLLIFQRLNPTTFLHTSLHCQSGAATKVIHLLLIGNGNDAHYSLITPVTTNSKTDWRLPHQSSVTSSAQMPPGQPGSGMNWFVRATS